MKVILAEYDTLLHFFNALESKLSMPIIAAKLSKLTLLVDKNMNNTRWSSKYSKFEHYRELRNFISKLNRVENDDLMSNQAHNRRIESFLNDLFKL